MRRLAQFARRHPEPELDALQGRDVVLVRLVVVEVVDLLVERALRRLLGGVGDVGGVGEISGRRGPDPPAPTLGGPVHFLSDDQTFSTLKALEVMTSAPVRQKAKNPA